MIFLRLKKINQLFLIFCFFFSCHIQTIFAQESKKINPLTSDFKHELIPGIRRGLTPFEQKRIKEKITELETLASEKISADKADEAFTFLYEAINLSHSLGLDYEMEMITKVGTIAWEQRRGQDLNFLQARLLVLEQQNSNNNGIKKELLPLFIEAYDSIHYLDKSIALNQQYLSFAREEQNDSLIPEILERLGELYLAKFDYYPAQPIYQELLNIARSNQDYLSESIYLQKLAEISQALVEPKNSVQYKQELAQYYQQNNILIPLSRLKIAIGDDYKALDNPQSASESYQSAFSLALSLEQYAIAGDALKKLGKLYQEYEEFDSALQIYQELIIIEKNSYNFYGLMNTYDFIGNIYSQKEDYQEALNSFEKALAIARELQYKEDYFLQKISQVQSLNSN